MEGDVSPIYRGGGNYIIPIQIQIESYQCKNPPPTHNLAFSVATINLANKIGKTEISQQHNLQVNCVSSHYTFHWALDHTPYLGWTSRAYEQLEKYNLGLTTSVSGATSVSSNPSSAGRFCNNEYYKSKEQEPGPDHSPRIPRQHKTLPCQNTDGTSPPHPEQRRDQKRLHIGGLHKQYKRRYTHPTYQLKSQSIRLRPWTRKTRHHGAYGRYTILPRRRRDGTQSVRKEW